MKANYGHLRASIHLAVKEVSLYKKSGVLILFISAEIHRVQLFYKGPLHLPQVKSQILLSKHA